jgi:AcrR family transcriptional regulator
MSGERLRDVKREATRDRLLDVGLQLISEHGYDGVTAAEIAEAANVTERTFFRHFPSKADLVMANWKRIAASMEDAMARQPAGTSSFDVVRAGVLAFASDLKVFVEGEPEQALALYGGKLPLLTMLEVVLALETAISQELAARLDRSDEDLDVRIAANAAVGILRACGRTYAQNSKRRSVTRMVSDRLELIRALFDELGP